MFVPDIYDMPWKRYPGRKPVNLVKIDWSHPDSKGLTLCVIFQMGRYYDLVSGRQLFVSTSAVQHPDGALFNGTDAYLTIPDVVLDSAYSITMLNYANSNAGSNLNYFLSFNGVTVANSCNWFITGDSASGPAGQTKFFGDFSSDIKALLSGITFAALNDKTATVAVEGTNGELIIGGESVAVNAGFGNYPMANGTKSTLYVGGRTDLSATRFWPGTTKLLFIHDYKVDAAMARRLNDNPYAFIIKA